MHKITNKILKFIKIPNEEKMLFLEAFLLFLLSYILVNIFPLKFYSSFIGNYMKEITLNDKISVQTALVFRAINRAKKALPFNPKCFVNSIVAKKMLDKRKIKNILYLGLNKNNDNELKAHAWLKINNNNFELNYNVIAFFT